MYVICLSDYQNVLNMADELYYNLNTVWAWKLNHNKDSRRVSPITDSQNLQAQICADTLGHETDSTRKFCWRNTAQLLECRTSFW